MAPRFAFVPARWLAPDSGLAPSDRLTLCVLCQWVNRESGECWPAVATIAAHAALSENTVRASLKKLVEVGAVTVQRRRDSHGDPDTNLYTILGYDPPAKKGGTSATAVPVLQPLQGGTATGVFEVPQPLHPNVVKENKEVDVPPLVGVAPSGTASSGKRIQPPPYAPAPNPLADITDAVPMPEGVKSDWREALK